MMTDFISLLVSQVGDLDQPGAISQALTALAQAFHDQKWALLVGMVLMILVYIAKKFDVVDRLPKAAIPVGTVILAMLASIGIGLQQGMSLMSIITTGLLAGFTAIGAWETAGQHVAAAISPVSPAPMPPPTPPSDAPKP